MERINILEKLKDTPIGTKLYSPICGECSLRWIGVHSLYPIEVCDILGDAIFLEKMVYM